MAYPGASAVPAAPETSTLNGVSLGVLNAVESYSIAPVSTRLLAVLPAISPATKFVTP